MERLQGIAKRPHRLRPAQSSKVSRRGVARGRGAGPGGRLTTCPAYQIACDHRAEFARCLEPLLLPGPRWTAGAGGGTNS